MSGLSGTMIKPWCLPLLVFLLALLSCQVCPSPVFAADPAMAAAIAAGEKIYRQGLLPSGEAVQAIVKGDIPVEGTAFSCQSCHLRGGLGSTEGGVYTPPTNAAWLFQPVKKLFRGVELKHFYGEDSVARPAYTDKSLADLLRDGISPTGKMIGDVMPRYLLKDTDMGYLIAYLRTLSASYSPGVTSTTVRFATIYTEDTRPEDREALLAGLEEYFHSKNETTHYFGTPKTGREMIMAKSMLRTKKIETRNLTLSQWVLKGPPETWRSQLEDFNRKEPPFAILGGVTPDGEWASIHAFCEENKIPCLFPSTDLPVISEKDWYTVYLSKGYYQEGEAAAGFLHSLNEAIRGKQVVQVVRGSRQGRALAEGFGRTWRALDHGEPTTVTLKEGDELTATRLSEVMGKDKPTVLLLWDGPGALPSLEAVAADQSRPEMVFMSSRYLDKATWALPEKVRSFTYLTYPYRLPQDKAKDAMGAEMKFQTADNLTAKHTLALVQLLNMGSMKIKGNYYRDHFLDIVDSSMDLVVPLYERISFGPGQRYASKGCYIVQLAPGTQPLLIKKNNWVNQ